MELFIVEKDNSLKLELGTKTMNVLVTSSIRIDKNQLPAVGPSSTNGFSVSKDTMIFIRRSFIEWYSDLRQRGFNDLSIRELYPFDEYAQLRQVRSKFHRTTTSFSILFHLHKRSVLATCYNLDTCRPQRWYEQGFRCKSSVPVVSNSRGICLGTRRKSCP